MNYQLIADAGSSKTDWALISGDNGEVEKFSTPGLNALLADEESVASMLEQVKEHLPPDFRGAEIHYYGAGCATQSVCRAMKDALESRLEGSRAIVESDLLGAARGLAGHEKGIVCILGTGSNSCSYNGETITEHIQSLGFILGDEGSGAALGKRLVADAFKGRLPEPVKEAFTARYGLTLEEILNKVYREPAPNKFLASLVPFIKEHLWNPYVYAMVRREFEEFLERNVSPYEDSRSVPVSYTGSIAFHFSDILREVAFDEGYFTGRITHAPLDGLIKFHKQA